MKLVRSICFAGLLASASIAASATPLSTVTFSVTYDQGSKTWGTGTFSGNDINNDGFLSLSELISFDGSKNIESQAVTLANLSGFGSFDIASNVWMANGSGWGQKNFAYFSWNGDANSVNNNWAAVKTSVVTTNVPEPASMALLALGCAGLVAARRRK